MHSNDNNGLYETTLFSHAFEKIVSQLNGNAIVFNYPGVGASSGLPDRQAMEKAYRALLNFLEDKEKGIGAKEIIGYGISLGGGVQGDALKSHPLKKDIKYVFVKDRTFSKLECVISSMIHRIVGLVG